MIKLSTKFHSLFNICMGAFCLSLAACKKDNPKPSMTIIGFTPTHGFTGDTITITGTNFSASDSIYFNGASVNTVINATPTQVKVLVPNDATSGNIRIKGTTTVTSSSIFTVDHLVYVCGSDNAGRACYWKNDTEVVLSAGDASTIAIYVSGKDVYVAGNDGSKAVYWKNGIEIPLTNGLEYAYTKSIYVAGKDVYVAGNTPNNGNTATDVATYWINNASTAFYLIPNPASPKDYAYANSIYVSGKDVYVAGNIGYSSYAVYWKNGSVVNLTDESYSSVANAIYISASGDVYVAGSLANAAEYWKNGVAINLSDETVSVANSIYVSANNDVYIAGEAQDIYGIFTAKYWKNGVVNNLSDGSVSTHANSIYVSGNDVYIAGNGIINTYPYNYVAEYWKNGVPIILSSGGQSTAMDIFVR